MREHFEIIVNSLIYILNKFENKETGLHKLFKILYFAERKHLSRYGKTITGDTFYAFEYGPVPNDAYNILKASRSQLEVKNEFLNIFSKYFEIRKNHQVHPLAEVDLDWLSISERKCLDEAFEENKDLSFGRLTKKSHDSAWEKAYHVLAIEDIAEAGGASEEMLAYISSKQELKRLRF